MLTKAKSFIGLISIIIFYLILILTKNIYSTSTEFTIERAEKLLKRGYPDSALILLNNLYQQDHRNYKALYYMAQTYTKLDSPIFKAACFLDIVAKKNPQCLEDQYAVASIYEQAERIEEAYKYYKQAINKKLKLPDSQEAFSRTEERLNGPGSGAVKILATAVLQNPKNKKLYDSFIASVIRNNQADIGIKTLEKLPIEHAEFNQCLDLAYFYFNKKNYARALDLIKLMKTKPNYSAFRAILLNAKVLFDQMFDQNGLQLYWTAIDSIKNELELKQIREDLYYLFTKKEALSFSEAKPNQIKNELIQFWGKRDPDLTTIQNERIPEHFRRLSNALRYYRRYKSVQAIDYIPNHFELDDAGVIYVKHGPPDLQVCADAVDISAIVVEDGIHPDLTQENEILLKKNVPGYGLRISSGISAVAKVINGEGVHRMERIPRSVSWKYEAFSNQNAMIFHFSYLMGGPGWTFTLVPASFVNRWALGGVYAQVEQKIQRNTWLTDQGDQHENLNKLQEVTEGDKLLGLSSERSNYTKQASKIDHMLIFKCFKGVGGKSLVELYYSLPYNKLELLNNSKSKYFQLKTRIAFYGAQWQELLRKEIEKQYDATTFIRKDKKGAVVLVQRYMLPPDSINFEFHISNSGEDERGISKGRLVVDDFAGSKLKMSDIILSGAIDSTTTPTVFRKGKVTYSPHMFHPYNSGDIIGLYFELYNLVKDQNNLCQTQVTCYLKTLDQQSGLITSHTATRLINLLGKVAGNSMSSFIYEGENSDEPFYLNLDIGKRKKGKYQLVVVAQDLRGSEIAKTIDFIIN